MEAEIRAGEVPTADLFSGMPPLEAFVVLIRVFVGHAPDGGEPHEFAFYDIGRSNFSGVATRCLRAVMQGLRSLQSGSMRRTTRWRSRKERLFLLQGFRMSGSWALPGEEKIDGMEENMYGTVENSTRTIRRRASGVLQGAVRRA
eukprot:3144157-Heterocapsa_arctica.AAC.1